MTELLATIGLLFMAGWGLIYVAGLAVRLIRPRRDIARPVAHIDTRRRPPGLDSDRPELILAAAVEELGRAELWAVRCRDQGDPEAGEAVLHLHRAWSAVNRVLLGLERGEVGE